MNRESIEDLATLGVVDAYELADAAIDLMILTLTRDPSIPPRLTSEWWTALADTRARIAEEIHRRVDAHVDIEDVLRALQFEGMS
jgi:hypothetical protein